MDRAKQRYQTRLKRKARVRRKVKGTAECPRLCVFRSAKHMYAQLIDDENGRTLVATGTTSPALRDKIGQRGNVTAAQEVGKALAEKALAQNCSEVVFDRNGFLYHGRVKALADAARDGGLKF